jgi:hypothetical protein
MARLAGLREIGRNVVGAGVGRGADAGTFANGDYAGISYIGYFGTYKTPYAIGGGGGGGVTNMFINALASAGNGGVYGAGTGSTGNPGTDSTVYGGGGGGGAGGIYNSGGGNYGGGAGGNGKSGFVFIEW